MDKAVQGLDVIVARFEIDLIIWPQSGIFALFSIRENLNKRENLARSIDELSPGLQNGVEDFVEFLWEKKTKKSG